MIEDLGKDTRSHSTLARNACWHRVVLITRENRRLQLDQSSMLGGLSLSIGS